MDTELLRTFVEVCRCGHFGKAADRLYVTQSAVSARIRQLESSLGCQLLIRQRKQLRVTTEGERFLAHASALLKQWERVRRDMAESAAGGAPLRVGAIPAIWDGAAVQWLTRYRKANPGSVRIGSGESDQLMSRLSEGALDVVFLHDPPRLPGIEHRCIGKLQLVLSSTSENAEFATAVAGGYIELDWGGVFAAAQAEFMENARHDLRMDSMHCAVAWLRENAGAAYLPEETVVREPQLFAVRDAPRFTREVHACWPERADCRESIERFLEMAST